MFWQVGNTALHMAAEGGFQPIVELLLEKEANAKAENLV